MILTNNESLTSLDGLDSLWEIEGSIEIKNNRNLLNLDGLDSLTDFEGWVIAIQYNHQLCDELIDAFIDAMEAIGFTETVSVWGNDSFCT